MDCVAPRLKCVTSKFSGELSWWLHLGKILNKAVRGRVYPRFWMLRKLYAAGATNPVPHVHQRYDRRPFNNYARQASGREGPGINIDPI